MKFVLIDGYSYLYQVYHAISGLTGPRGEPVNAIFGFVRMVLDVRKKVSPTHIAVAWDTAEPSFRHKAFSDYKATRKPMPPDLAVQVPVVKEIIAAYRFAELSAAGYEADDVIATLVARLSDDAEILIVSRDKDLRQLLRRGVAFYDTKTGKLYTESDFVAEFGFAPSLFPDYLALVGDKSDNIPGVSGIGKKTAASLIQKFGSLEEIYANAQLIDGRYRRRLLEARTRVFEMRELVRVRTDVPLQFEPDSARVRKPDVPTLLKIFSKYNFKKFLEELSEWMDEAVDVEECDYRLVDTEEELEKVVRGLRGAELLAVDTETTSEDQHECRLVGVSLSAKPKTGFYIPVEAPAGEGRVSVDALRRHIGPLLEDEAQKKAGQNIKYDYQVLKRAGIQMRGMAFDTMVAAYLVDPESRGYGLDALALRYLGRKNRPIEALIGKGKEQITMDEVPTRKVCIYACEDVDVVLRLVEVLSKEMDEIGVRRLFDEVEMPLVEVLAEMELAGVRVDADYLRGLAEELRQQLQAVKERIFELAGHKFNIDSPQQLAKVLYEELKLPRLRRTKTGKAATDQEVLAELAKMHPLPQQIVHYRTVSKMLSTYVESLPALVRADGRVHTSFNQTATATGRLSSSEPNLQNIPVRDEVGRLIRRAFVPSYDDWWILSADYSQVELRFLAHFSEDPELIKAFCEGVDIHTAVAAALNGVAPEAVSADMRRQAKVVNFGIVYGLSPHGLATELGISHQEAKDYIEAYFRRYAKVKEFIERTVEFARKNGYVRTIAGRIRYIGGFASSDKHMQALAERTAVNTVMQGSSADLIKVAMVSLHRRLKEEDLKTRMILQIHDELLFDVPDAELQRVQRMVRQEMEGALSLRVPLKVDMGVGRNWLEAK